MVNSIGTKIRELRKAKGISIEELSREAYCASNYLGALERGAETHRNPTIDTLIKIAAALNVAVSDLLDESTGAK